jgi:hypothetical protein
LYHYRKCGDATLDEQTVKIHFSAFDGVDWTQVDSLYVGLDSSRVPDTEKHEIQVAEVEFTR